MVLISVKWLFMHFDSCHAYIFYIQLFQKRIKIQINIWRNTFYKERVHVYICGFLTSSILIDEVNNYTGVILTIACFDLNCPLFTCLDFWHRLSSIQMDLKSDVIPQLGRSFCCPIIGYKSSVPQNKWCQLYLMLSEMCVSLPPHRPFQQ